MDVTITMSDEQWARAAASLIHTADHESQPAEEAVYREVAGKIVSAVMEAMEP